MSQHQWALVHFRTRMLHIHINGTISSSCLQNVSHGQGGNDGAGIAAIPAINTGCAK